MLTPADIKKITDTQIKAQKDLFYTKLEIDEKFSQVLSVMDGIAKRDYTREREDAVMAYRVKRGHDPLN